MTSIEPNIDQFVPQGIQGYLQGKAWPESCRIVDFPGAPSKSYNMTQYIDSAKAIVRRRLVCSDSSEILCIDATDKKSLPRASELLHKCFSNFRVSALKTPILVALNKTELPEALPSEQIVSLMEKEM